jgi:glycosyltransferase involved in cell wall biosynthesis
MFEFQHDDNVDGVRYRRFSTRWDGLFLRGFRFVRNAEDIQRPLFSSDLWYPSYAVRVALDLQKQGCDIAHVYYYPQYANLIKRLNPGLRVILHMHGEWLTQVRFTNLYARLRKIDLIISCADLVTKSICVMFPEVARRCRTVPMGLSAEAFSGAYRNSLLDNLPPRRLLYVGRISPEKGVHVLLDAFKLILRQCPDASLTVVGPEWRAPRDIIVNLCLERALADSLAPFYKGSYLHQLKHRLDSEAAERVTFAGLVAHSEVPSYYARADVYINPSLYESFGVSIIEAMAAGIPVVATAVGAVPDLISDGQNGLLVKSASPAAIADGVIRLFKDARLRTSIARVAYERVRRQFSWDTICSSLMDIYGDLVERQPDKGEVCASAKA